MATFYDLAAANRRKSALLVLLVIGIFAALNHRKVVDRVTMSLAMTGICLPSFVIGPLLQQRQQW